MSFQGSYNVRPIRDGGPLSIHSWGAAVDEHYYSLDRQVCVDVVDWLIDNSQELHISSIHDYAGSRIWHRDRQAWKSFRGHGTPNDKRIHFETTLEGWDDQTALGDRPGIVFPGGKKSAAKAEPAIEWPPFDAVAGLWGLWPFANHKPKLKRGVHRSIEVNDATLYAQGVMVRDGASIDIDGRFGTNSYAAVTAFQAKQDGLDVDGQVGPNTWAAIDAAAGRLSG